MDAIVTRLAAARDETSMRASSQGALDKVLAVLATHVTIALDLAVPRIVVAAG